MQSIQVMQRGFGEYIHPEERVNLVDEATGNTYELVVKGTSEEMGQQGTVRIYIPDDLVNAVFPISGYFVVELAAPANEEEAQRRRSRLETIPSQ